MLKNGDKAKVTSKPTLPPRPLYGSASAAAEARKTGEAKTSAKPEKAIDAKAKPAKAPKLGKPTRAIKEKGPKLNAAAKLREGSAKAGAIRKAAKAGTATDKLPKPRASRADGAPTKRSLAIDLLKRKEGTTLREILDATGWPAVSVPEIAKAGNLDLRKEKPEGEKVTRYWGTPKAAA